MTALAMRGRRWAGIWISPIGGDRIRAAARGRPRMPISTTCRDRWQHEVAADAVASLRSGYLRPTRHHRIGTACISTGRGATYRNRNAIAKNRATSKPAVFGLPFLERRTADPVPATDIRRRMAALLLAQDTDDLFLGERQSPHRPSPSKRTLPKFGDGSDQTCTMERSVSEFSLVTTPLEVSDGSTSRAFR